MAVLLNGKHVNFGIADVAAGAVEVGNSTGAASMVLKVASRRLLLLSVDSVFARYVVGDGDGDVAVAVGSAVVGGVADGIVSHHIDASPDYPCATWARLLNKVIPS